jgi:hypothetical protein
MSPSTPTRGRRRRPAVKSWWQRLLHWTRSRTPAGGPRGRCRLTLEGLETRDLPTTTVPYQFLAKMYTEALGRAPDQPGWQNWVNYFQQNPASPATLRAVGQAFYNQYGEFGADYGNNSDAGIAARLLALYRGALNREPDAGGFSDHFNRLKSGADTWEATVNNFFNSDDSSSEFMQSVVPKIIGTDPSRPGLSGYGFGASPVLPAITPTPNPGGWSPTGTDAQAIDNDLQNRLNTAGPGTFYLAPEAVIPVVQTITVPAGVTLATYGNPGPRQYALMARLVRVAAWGDAVVHVTAGANLNSVWVDGSANRLPDSARQGPAWNIRVTASGTSSSGVSSDRSINTVGDQHILAEELVGTKAGNITITNNLITGYANKSDGIGVFGPNVSVTSNTLIDVSNVGIVVFPPSPAPQDTDQTLVSGNILLLAGVPADGFLAIDPVYHVPGGLPAGSVPDFSHTFVQNNTFWTGYLLPSDLVGQPYGASPVYAQIGIWDGGRPLWGDAAFTGTGAVITGNSTGSLQAWVGTGIVVSGMTHTTVINNLTTTSNPPTTNPNPLLFEQFAPPPPSVRAYGYQIPQVPVFVDSRDDLNGDYLPYPVTVGSYNGRGYDVEAGSLSFGSPTSPNPPTSATAGKPFAITVTAKNFDGAPATAANNNAKGGAGYQSVVQFTSSDPYAVFIDPATGKDLKANENEYLFTLNDTATHTIYVILNSPGSQTITATDLYTHSITATTGQIQNNPAPHVTSLLMGQGSNQINLFRVGQDGRVYTNYFNGQGWLSGYAIDGARFPVDAHISALLMDTAGHINLFGVDLNGHVVTTYWNGTSWGSWYVVQGPNGTTPTFPVGGDIAALLMDAAGHINLFGVDANGHVETTYWAPGWTNWYTVQGPNSTSPSFPAGTGVSALLMDTAGHINLFAVDVSGHVETTYWAPGWTNWYGVQGPNGAPATFPVEADIAALLMDTAGHINLFGTDVNGRVETTYWTGSGWLNWYQVQGPNGAGTFPAGADVAALLMDSAGHINLFVVGLDGYVYTTYWTGSGWTNWYQVRGANANPTFPVGGDVSALLMDSAGHINLFAVDANGHVETTYWAPGWLDWYVVPGI